jgi:hypothetical protein
VAVAIRTMSRQQNAHKCKQHRRSVFSHQHLTFATPTFRITNIFSDSSPTPSLSPKSSNRLPSCST